MSGKSAKALSKERAVDSDSETETFTPPKGYTLMTGQLPDGALDGKEVWLFKVPAGIPIESIGQVPVPGRAGARRTFKAGAADVTVWENAEEAATEAERIKLYVPTGKGNYKLASSKIRRVFQLDESVTIPRIHIDREAVKHRTPDQPTGLKMRYKPTGYGDADFSDSEPETPKKAKKHKADKADDKDAKSKKRKHSDNVPAEPKKAKEHREKKKKRHHKDDDK
ncbi:DNA-directed RNA polymerase I, subunit RPA34.5 [Dipodascopsis tothii]|uniref:DNA-directed RNA polymerase I, subunit RPA34.5 n=1 Tax=Dipodascopsis tothii TaxID=44089 RepID=UPI0034CF3345